MDTLDFLLSNYPSTAWYRLELLRGFISPIRVNVILPGDLELSPDGKRLIFRRVDFHTGSISLWLTDLERGTPSRFTFEKTSDFSPIWSPDGSRIVFSTLRDGPPNLYQKVSSSAGNDEGLLKSLVPKLSFD